MQFSLRRMLLAVAVSAATLGTFSLYAKRFGVVRSDNWWWATVTVAASAIGAALLVGRRRDLGRIVNASVWTLLGFIAGATLRGNYWLVHALFFLFGRIPWLFDDCILGGLIGWFIGCILFRWLWPPRSPPHNNKPSPAKSASRITAPP